MSKHDKLLKRFLSKPKDFTYSELKTLLQGFDYDEKQGSGARVKFYNEELDHNFKVHKPHPKPYLKPYQINEIIEGMEEQGLI